ncbi:MAG TPA: hypothetical protein VLC95_07245 [Anaerolineae bacterium]|nr:hypothetical protein [Anaerolineae bacterium]
MESEEYVHRPLGQEVTAIGGHYLLVKEVRLAFEGREVLYVVGHAAFDTTCCGVGGCAYALVPGFVLRWKEKTSQDGPGVSEVEPVRDTRVQQEIEWLIQKQEIVQQVVFL